MVLGGWVRLELSEKKGVIGGKGGVNWWAEWKRCDKWVMGGLVGIATGEEGGHWK